MSEHTNLSATQTKTDISQRSEWHRPELRKLDAREAEVSTSGAPDAGLGQS